MISRIEADLSISLLEPGVRRRYEAEPGLLSGEVAALTVRDKHFPPLVVLDEIQRVPVLLDAIQHLIDGKKARFILTGSSARKLRRGSNVNLLPGRVVSLRLDPFVLSESKDLQRPLEDHLLEGDLPLLLDVEIPQDREIDLCSYVNSYLEEEVRAEALVRNLGPFTRFLELAASESGNQINARKLSMDIGVAQNTIASYYQILEDCLIIERIHPLTQSHSRKKLAKTDKFLFFDLGVRRLAAGEGRRQTPERMGVLFEQFVGLQLLRCARLSPQPCQLRYWRDGNGPEVDWVLELDGCLTPIEVKWTDTPRTRDIRHLKLFLSEYPQAEQAYVVCRVPRRVKLHKNVFAIPWRDCGDLVPKEGL